MQIHPGHTRPDHAFRKMPQKAIWHPLVHVFAPDCFAPVNGCCTNPELLALAKRQRMDRHSVSAKDRGLQRKHGVRRCAAYIIIGEEKKKRGWEAKGRLIRQDGANRKRELLMSAVA
jgi:hypothetical protein